jgi:hypothetical protein
MQGKAVCVNGHGWFAEFTGSLCPQCSEPAVEAVVDFGEYRPLLEEIFKEIVESVKKYGNWTGYSPKDIREKVDGEFCEYHRAYQAKIVDGEHGQRDELRDLAVVSVKGMLQLDKLNRVFAVKADSELRIGEYRILVYGDSSCIEHVSGEAMQTSTGKLAAVIDQYYQENF